MIENNRQLEEVKALVDVIAALRDPKTGCPWDKEQTHQSLKNYMIEEAYELVEAINAGADELREELGDVLLQVLLHSQIASEGEGFDFFTVVKELKEKLIRRHPHVFGDVVAKTPQDVVETWQKIKKSEKGLLDGVPKALPALLRTAKISDRVRSSGVDVNTFELEKLQEFAKKILDQGCILTADDFKKGLFQIAILAAQQKLNPEELLQEACNELTEEFKAKEKESL